MALNSLPKAHSTMEEDARPRQQHEAYLSGLDQDELLDLRGAVDSLLPIRRYAATL